VQAYGKPVAFYSDKLGVFRVNRRDATGEELTQFGRALAALTIDILCAGSPQAKGRVERAFGTLQDRLVKQLRLAGISGVEAANTWPPGFIADYNQRFGQRFGREPANAKDLHRPHYDRMMLRLEPTTLARSLVRKTVEVVNYPDGRFAVRHAGAAGQSPMTADVLRSGEM
jgi:hypothetical protein